MFLARRTHGISPGIVNRNRVPHRFHGFTWRVNARPSPIVLSARQVNRGCAIGPVAHKAAPKKKSLPFRPCSPLPPRISGTGGGARENSLNLATMFPWIYDFKFPTMTFQSDSCIKYYGVILSSMSRVSNY